MRLCLNMIVRNEAANIRRCLASVRSHVAAWVIADTGSTDGTQDIIREAMDGLPGVLVEFPFVTFEQARNAALDACRGSGLDFDHILFCDADMELVGSPLVGDGSAAYLIDQHAMGVTYPNIRIVRRDVPARYVGVTHEFLNVAGAASALPGAHFIDHADGANRPGKFDRDIGLLEDALVNETDDLLRRRYTFYLAQSYRDAGKPWHARRHYLDRAVMGGWQEEVYVSRLNAGRILARVDMEAGARELAAIGTLCGRAEALTDAARLYRLQGQHVRALECARDAAGLPKPDGALFVEDWVYAYGAKDELALAAWSLGGTAAAEKIWRALLDTQNIPDSERERIARNITFCAAA